MFDQIIRDSVQFIFSRLTSQKHFIDNFFSADIYRSHLGQITFWDQRLPGD